MNIHTIFRRAAIPALVLLAVVGIGGIAASALAQDAGASAAEQSEAAAPDVVAPDQPAASPVVSPVAAQQSQPPRTLRAYWHVFIAFAATWVLLFAYVVAIGRRWARLEREVRVLSVE